MRTAPLLALVSMVPGCHAVKLLYELPQIERAAISATTLALLNTPGRIPASWDFTLYYSVDPSECVSVTSDDGRPTRVCYDPDWAVLYEEMVATLQRTNTHPAGLAESLIEYVNDVAPKESSRSSFDQEFVHAMYRLGGSHAYATLIQNTIPLLSGDHTHETHDSSRSWSPQVRAALTGYIARAVGRGNFGIEVQRVAGDKALIRSRSGVVLDRVTASDSPETYSYVDRYPVEPRELILIPRSVSPSKALRRRPGVLPTRIPAFKRGIDSWQYAVSLLPTTQTVPIRDIMSGEVVHIGLIQSFHTAREQSPMVLGQFHLRIRFYWDHERKLAFEGWAMDKTGRRTFARILTRHTLDNANWASVLRETDARPHGKAHEIKNSTTLYVRADTLRRFADDDGETQLIFGGFAESFQQARKTQGNEGLTFLLLVDINTVEVAGRHNKEDKQILRLTLR